MILANDGQLKLNVDCMDPKYFGWWFIYNPWVAFNYLPYRAATPTELQHGLRLARIEELLTEAGDSEPIEVYFESAII